jgi:hypothetical protein
MTSAEERRREVAVVAARHAALRMGLDAAGLRVIIKDSNNAAWIVVRGTW